MDYGQGFYFTPKDEECAELLSYIGLKKNTAKVLVYLSQIPEATSREIERGTDLRQPEVSIVMRDLTKQGWVVSRKGKKERKGRPVNIYMLSLGIESILNQLEKEKHKEMEDHLKKITKLRAMLSGQKLPAS
ncbi:MAG: helix-turn-helix domain-containing protein [Methanoculleaceae archaeon]